MRIWFKQLLIPGILSLVVLSFGCTAKPVQPVEYTQPELSYLLLSHFGNVFWCDPDFYPVARVGQEEQNAVQQFSSIRADGVEFSAIIEHLGLLDKAEYTDAQKLQIYREYKKLKYALQLTPAGEVYDFTLRVGEGQGESIEGTITLLGIIKVLRRESSFNTCPICLIKGTLIDTPAGQIQVEDLSEGMPVWTVDGTGRRVAGVVVKTTFADVSTSFPVVRVTLDDGRGVAVSPGHPTANGRALGDYHAGDILDGVSVVAVDIMEYGGGATYDLLPSGATGLYWADGILLKSTLDAN